MCLRENGFRRRSVSSVAWLFGSSSLTARPRDGAHTTQSGSAHASVMICKARGVVAVIQIAEVVRTVRATRTHGVCVGFGNENQNISLSHTIYTSYSTFTMSPKMIHAAPGSAPRSLQSIAPMPHARGFVSVTAESGIVPRVH